MNEPRHVEELVPVNEAALASWKAWHEARLAMRLPRFQKDSEGHAYRYVSLPSMLAALDQPLREHGFVLRWTTWSPTAETVGVRCVLAHREGWRERAELIVKPHEVVSGRMSGAQARGAWITYAQRYTLLAVLGTTAEVDTDAAPEPVHSNAPDVVMAEAAEALHHGDEPSDGIPFATCGYVERRKKVLASMPRVVW